jgi:hypothetical protein
MLETRFCSTNPAADAARLALGESDSVKSRVFESRLYSKHRPLTRLGSPGEPHSVRSRILETRFYSINPAAHAARLALGESNSVRSRVFETRFYSINPAADAARLGSPFGASRLLPARVTD